MEQLVLFTPHTRMVEVVRVWMLAARILRKDRALRKKIRRRRRRRTRTLCEELRIAKSNGDYKRILRWDGYLQVQRGALANAIGHSLRRMCPR